MEASNDLYKSLERNVLRLMEAIRFLKKENEELKKQMKDHQETLAKMQQMLKEKEEQYELLKVSALLEHVEGKDVQNAGRKINSLGGK
jgi:nitrate reductase assembly molybdenum cofactor insertion protein NarJ